MIWTVLGVIATIIFGAWSLYYAIVGRRYPGRITFIQEACIGLFDSIVRNFPEITISYQNSPVGQSLVLLKGAFLNTGTKDITKEMVVLPLKIVLPQGYKWLTARVVAASPRAQPTIAAIEKSELAFDLSLFRCREYLRFEALAEVPASDESTKRDPEKSLRQALSFEHRIADTRKVDSTEVGLTDSRKKRAWTMLGFLAGNAIMATAGIIISFRLGNPNLEGDLRFLYAPSQGSQAVLVQITPLSDGTLRVKGVNENFEAVIPAETFFSGPRLKPSIARSHGEIINVAMMSGMLLFSVIAIAFTGIALRREFRLKNVLLLSPAKSRATVEPEGKGAVI